MIKIFAGILGIFGLLNLNDPDWYVWTPLYLQPVFIFSFYKIFPTLKAAKISTMCILVFLIFSIFGVQIHENQEINKMAGMSEIEREHLGVALVLFWNFFFLNSQKIKNKD